MPIILKSFTILEYCEMSGYKIPRFCYHENLSVAGNCRMCLVELTTSLKPVASCAMALSNIPKLEFNLSYPTLQLSTRSIIQVDTWLVKKAREGVLEFLLLNHPLDCPICDQGGECDLQDQALLFGSDFGRFHDYKRATSDKNCGPLVKTLMTRCIQCTRCVRFASEVAGFSPLGITGRGSSMEVGFYVDQLLQSEISGNIVDLCPVGALTSQPFSFMARSWELESFYAFDVFDSLYKPITIQTKGLDIFRILPRTSTNQEEWITDRIRYSYDSFFQKRLRSFTGGSRFSQVFCLSGPFLSWWLRVRFNLTFLFSLYFFQTVVDLVAASHISILLKTLSLWICNLRSWFILSFNPTQFTGVKVHQQFLGLNSGFGFTPYHSFNSTWVADFRSSFLVPNFWRLNSEAPSLNLVLNVGSANLRVQSPLVLTMLRKQVLKKGVQIFAFGSISASFFIKFLGSSESTLSSVYRGLHWLCSFLAVKSNYFINFNPYFSTASSTFPFWRMVNFPLAAGFPVALELGFQQLPTNFNFCSTFWQFSASESLQLKAANIIAFNTHASSVAFQAPCPFFFEINDFFIDCFALVKYSKQLLSEKLKSGITCQEALSSFLMYFVSLSLSTISYPQFLTSYAVKSLPLFGQSFSECLPYTLINKVSCNVNQSFYLSAGFFLLSATMLASERSFSKLESYGF